jgi:predicted tellurium resistance membrane protein TerC
MVALAVGIVLVIIAVVLCLPFIGWWADVLAFLKGSIPVIAILVGVVAILIGVADIKDKREVEKEEKEEAQAESKEAGKGEEEKKE